MRRGAFGFDVTSRGDLEDQVRNVELLRRLLLDRSVISGDELGEGDPGDFDHGAWHIACHLVAAGACAAPRMDGCSGWSCPTTRCATSTSRASRRIARLA